MKHFWKNATAVLAFAAVATMPAVASADIKVGVILSTTGPASAAGIPPRNTLAFWPTEIDGEKLEIILEDDRSDVNAATTAARRMISDSQVDILVGPSLTPNCVAVSAVANEAETVLLPLAPVPVHSKWTFNVAPSLELMAGGVVDHMVKNGVKTVGFIGYSDSWGDQWIGLLRKLGEPQGLQIVQDERFGRADTTVSGQALKLIASRPDAIFIAASFAGAALPQKTLVDFQYGGQLYQTQGIDRANFMRIAGDAAEGVVFPASPSTVAEKLPDDFPTKTVSLLYVNEYEAVHGPDSRNTSAAHVYDVAEILKVIVPVAKKAGAPGTREFRAALRDALEQTQGVVGSQGVYSFGPDKHSGLTDETARVVATIKDGEWILVE